MNVNKIILADKEHCTGCGACQNICSQHAITMNADNEGFIQPVIDNNLCISCGKCSQICPVLHPKYTNKMLDKCYAMWADDSLRAATSTAGFFWLAAQDTLKKNGIVFGAAWTDNWNVHHIGIEQEEDLPLLSGSKYLQSNIETSYQEVKNHLKQGRNVLFSGCPCQIAGLYSFLENLSTENLTTIEVLCHGVPSPKAFHKYLTDNFKPDKIQKINFRDKTRYFWSSSATISFSDNVEYHNNANADPFYKAFLPCMILRRSCANCSFSQLPRQADITIGDFWGIGNTDRSWDDHKGTELVLINNEKGQELFNHLKPLFQRYEEFPLEAATQINKTILYPFRSHPGRKHFFSSMDLKPFNQLVEDSLDHKYDIGVVGLWYGINYGSVLTYYALYQVLRDLGYDPVMLPKPNNLWEERFNHPTTIAQKFIWKHCNVFNPCRVQDEYPRMNDRCKDFIVGSDVVWNYDICGKDTDQFFFLDWVESGHKKIAYAASFGNGLSGTGSYMEKAKAHLIQFDSVSVREKNSVDAMQLSTGRSDINHVLDPVFICNPNHYFRIAAHNSGLIDEHKPFVFAYILRKSMAEQKLNLIDKICAIYQADSKICGNPNEMESSKRLYGSRLLPEVSVEEWIYYISKCVFYIGDSYHALCFSLIFHRPFIIIYGKADYSFSGERFYSLLKLVGLEDRLLENLDDSSVYNELIQKPIDWEDVDRRLNQHKEASLQWLKEALKQQPKTQTAVDFEIDAFKRRISEYGVQIFEQKQQLENQAQEIRQLKEQLNALYTSDAWKDLQVITWLPKKLYGVIRCYRDHGLAYTLKSYFINNFISH